MFKFDTFALCLIMALPGLARAADNNCYESYSEALVKLNTNRTSDYVKKKKDIEEGIAECEERLNKRVGNCGNVESDFKDTVNKFKSTCESAGLRTSTQTGSIACSHDADKCQCASKGLSVTEKAYLECTGVDVSKLKYCPQVAEANQDRIDKKREKAEERIDKAKEKMRTLQDDLQKNEEKAEEKKKDARKDKTKADEDYAKSLAEAKKDASAKRQEMYARMNEIQTQMLTANQGVSSINLKTLEAKNKLIQAKVEIELNCTRQATATVNAMQTEAVQAIRGGTYNLGGQADLFRRVGLTDRQAWQQQAARRKRWCMASEETIRSIESQNQMHAATLETIDAEMAGAKAQVAALQQQMAQIQNGGPCSPTGAGTATAANGMPMETTACKDQREQFEQGQELMRVQAAAHAAAEEEIKAATDSLGKTNASKTKQIGELKNEIESQQTMMDQLQDVEEARSIAGDRNAARQRASRAMEDAVAQMTDHAFRVNRCCDVRNPSIGSQTCTSAKGFLTTRGVSVDDPPNAPSTSGTRTPPPPPGGPRTMQTPTGGSNSNR